MSNRPNILFLHSVLFDSVLTSYRGGTPELFAPRRTTFPSRTADSVVVVTLEKDGEACPPTATKTVCRFFASHTFDSLRSAAWQHILGPYAAAHAACQSTQAVLAAHTARTRARLYGDFGWPERPL